MACVEFFSDQLGRVGSKCIAHDLAGALAGRTADKGHSNGAQGPAVVPADPPLELGSVEVAVVCTMAEDVVLPSLGIKCLEVGKILSLKLFHKAVIGVRSTGLSAGGKVSRNLSAR